MAGKVLTCKRVQAPRHLSNANAVEESEQDCERHISALKSLG